MEIVNIVAIVKLSALLDLQNIAKRLEMVESSSRGKSWLKMRLPPENYYIAFYKSGKFLVTGVKSPDAISDVAERVLQILRIAGFDLCIESITIHNIVMVGDMKLNASLEKIIYSLDSSKASYEPEQFPGLIYRDFGVSFLLFPRGKFVVTGLKNSEAGNDAIEKFKQRIQNIF